MFISKINACLKELTNTNLELEVKEKSEFEKEAIIEKVEKPIKVSSNLNPNFVFANTNKDTTDDGRQ